MQQYFSNFLVGCELKQNLTVFNRKKKKSMRERRMFSE